HTPQDCCVRFAGVVTFPDATLATGRCATILPGPDLHRLERASFAWRTENGLSVFAPHTAPAGGRYSLVEGGGVVLIRSNIQSHCGPPRATAFRRQWAAVNAWLNPLQLDLLQQAPVPPRDRMCGMLVITAHSRWGEPTVPAYVGLGIPNADLTNWVRLIAITDLLALYHDTDVAARKPSEAPVKIKDMAVPRLKKRPDAG
ncbi:MAG: hypothetical protein JO007_11790, partial [Alphaproteobacteria bacterium]|nr:hypothetical protein [Alphaproteobacteria bacterium]